MSCVDVREKWRRKEGEVVERKKERERERERGEHWSLSNCALSALLRRRDITGIIDFPIAGTTELICYSM